MVFQAITHGDEVGPLPALLDVMSALQNGQLTFGGQVRFVLGNPEAALQGTRFVEQDLNRVFVEPHAALGGPTAPWRSPRSKASKMPKTASKAAQASH